MNGLNNVTLLGRVTKDIELRKTTSGKSVVSFNLAIDRKAQKGTTDFIDCVAWNKSAEYLNNYAHKGDLVSVIGSLQKREYMNNGIKVYVTEVHTNDVSIVASKKEAPVTFEETPAIDVTDDMLPF